MSQEIAQTIRQQIGKLTLMRLASHNFAFINGEEGKHLGGLTFKIRANPKLRGGGRVTVLLDFNDTYSVIIVNNRGREISNDKGIGWEQLRGPSGVIEKVTG